MFGRITATNRSFGFVATNGGGPELFFHRSALCGGLRFGPELLGERVDFDIVDGPRGPEAANVRPVEFATVAGRAR